MFRDDRDRDSFLDRFGDIFLESSTSCRMVTAQQSRPFSPQNRKDSHSACNEEASDGLCSG